MKTMNALRLEKFGAPRTLSLQDIANPELRPGEVLVEVHASAINPSDVKNVAGSFNASLPTTPGRDYAGVVVAGDPAWRGKKVWGSGAGFGMARNGAHAQFLPVVSDWLSEMPASLSMEQAAAVGAPYVTAWTTLIDAAKLQAGETVLITGAAGAVGRAATQIGRWKKARVIGAIHSGQAPGADAVVHTKEQDLPTEIKALTDGKGVNVVLDTVGGSLFEAALKSLAFDGRQVAISSVGTRRVEFDLVDFYRGRQRLIGVDTAKLAGVEIARIMDALRVGFDDGIFQSPAIRTWRLDQAVEAYGLVEKGRFAGQADPAAAWQMRPSASQEEQ
jgi:NADPH2:quinone reductase